jgi:hypothetical protein
MSDIIQDADELVDEAVIAAEPTDDEVGLTSEETGEEKKKSLLASMTIFDAMLIVSLICIGLATILLFFELREFGAFPGGFPWRTTEILNS